MGFNHDGTIKIDTKLDNSGIEKGVDGIKKSISGAATAISVAAAAAGAAILKMGADFEQSAAKASTLFGDVAVDVDNLNAKVLQLSSSTGLAATEINESLYSALSAGIPVTEDMGAALEVVEKSSKLATAGFTSVDTALSATAKTLNAYNMDVSETDRIQGILIQTQNKGITTVDELGASLAQVTPTAAAFGVSFENVGAALATMTAQGTPTAQATTQLNSLIAELGKSGTVASENLVEAAKGTKYAGMSFAEMTASGASLDEILALLDKSAKANGVSMVDMFSSIEAGKAALSIMTNEGAKFADNLAAMNDTAGLVEEGYDKMMNTLSGQTKIMKESVKNLGVEIYNHLDGSMTRAVKSVNSAIGEIAKSLQDGNLGKAVDFLINNFDVIATVVAAAAATMLVFKASVAITSAINAASTAVAAFTAAQAAATAAGTACTGTLTAFQLIVGVLTGKISLATAAQVVWNTVMSASPVGLVVTGITALIGVIALLCVAFKEEETEYDILIQKTNERTQKIREMQQAYMDMAATQKTNADADLAQIANAEEQYRQLTHLVDVNGRVLEGKHAEAQFLVNHLNPVLGTELRIINGQVVGYRELTGNIAKTIEAKKAEVATSAMLPLYEEAIKNAAVAEKERIEIAREQAELQRQLAAVEAQSAAQLENEGFISGELTEKKFELLKALEANEIAYDAVCDTQEQASHDMQLYSKACTAAIEGDTDTVISCYARMGDGFIEAADIAEKSQSEQARILTNQYTNSMQAIEDYIDSCGSEIDEEERRQIDAMKKHAEASKKEMEKVGVQVIDGIIVGIDGEEINLHKRVDALAKSIPDWAREMLGIHSPSRVMCDQIGKHIPTGVAAGIKENEKKATEAFENMLEALDYQYQAGIINEEQYYAELTKLRDKYLTEGTKEWIEASLKILDYQNGAYDRAIKDAKWYYDIGAINEAEYYRRLEEYRDTYLEENSEEWRRATLELLDYQERTNDAMADSIADTYTAIADVAKAKIDEIIAAQEKLASKLKDYGGLYDKWSAEYTDADGNVHKASGVSLRDIGKDNEVLQEYSDSLKQAKSRVGNLLDEEQSEEFFGIMRDMGIDEGANFAKALNEATDAELKQYIEDWKTKQQLSNEIAEDLYTDDLQKVVEDTNEALIDAYGELPEGFWDFGEDAAENFAEAFIEKLSELEGDIQAKVDAVTAKINASVSSIGVDGGGGNTYSRAYYFTSNGQSVSEQIQQAEDAAILEEHRNG